MQARDDDLEKLAAFARRNPSWRLVTTERAISYVREARDERDALRAEQELKAAQTKAFPLRKGEMTITEIVDVLIAQREDALKMAKRSDQRLDILQAAVDRLQFNALCAECRDNKIDLRRN